MQIRPPPAQCIEADQHVVADGKVDGTQLEQVERERLAVVAGSQKARDSRDLAGVSLLRKREQPGKGLRAGGRRHVRSGGVRRILGFDIVR